MKPWVNRIGGGRNAKRLQHSTANETKPLHEAQQDLENDIETFAGTAASLDAPQRKPLQSLLRHREGLEVYDTKPHYLTTCFCGSCSSPVPVHNRRDFSRRITQPTFPTSVANLRDILEHTIREAILFQVLDNGVWTSYCQTFHCQAAMAS